MSARVCTFPRTGVMAECDQQSTAQSETPEIPSVQVCRVTKTGAYIVDECDQQSTAQPKNPEIPNVQVCRVTKTGVIL